MEIPWVIGEQTKVKHQLLKSYINPWMKILYDTQKRYDHKQELLYFDGFSGPGIYYTDDSKQTTCSGSPLIVAEEANYYIEQDRSRDFMIICIDRNSKCVKILQRNLDEANRNSQRWGAYPAEFDEAVNELLDYIEQERLNMPPSFFFIDPFGFTGFPLSTLDRILTYPRVELFINLDVYDIVRFCEDSTKENSLFDLFDTKEFIEIRAMDTSQEKYAFLLNLYCYQLMTKTNANYVMPFKVYTPRQKGRVRYYLVHVSKHFKALKLMKDIMAKISESEYEFEAMGVKDMQLSLFESPEIELREGLISFCRESDPRPIDYDQIEKWAYINTSGVSKTIKLELLNLEEEKIVQINRRPRQRANAVTSGAHIIYRGE